MPVAGPGCPSACHGGEYVYGPFVRTSSPDELVKEQLSISLVAGILWHDDNHSPHSILLVRNVGVALCILCGGANINDGSMCSSQ